MIGQTEVTDRRLGGHARAVLLIPVSVGSRDSSLRIKLVHNGDMRVAEPKTVRQSVSLPANVASQVRTMAKSRRLSATRMLVELIENGIEAEKRKQHEFFELAERFRKESNPAAAKRLGDQLGRMVFGG